MTGQHITRTIPVELPHAQQQSPSLLSVTSAVLRPPHGSLYISCTPCKFFRFGRKMLAVFEKSIGNPPEELSLPLKGKMPPLGGSITGEEIVEIFRSWQSDSTLYSHGSSNMVLSHEDECPLHPRSIVVVDDVSCIFVGLLENMCELRRHYGLSRQAAEAMVVVEAYKVLRDRAPYPPDQVIRDLQGRFAFVLFDSRAVTLLLARIGTEVSRFNGQRRETGRCIFMNTNGLISVDHPLNKVRAIAHEDKEGNICGVIFQVDLFTRLRSIPRSGSAANWAGATAVEGE
ncbi:hypothetical protein RHSIM_Rhsim02G0128500 [Rhododendron simsii]|uniref:DUF3700 domain-containing protein n=1 Tax=Rhododendron simsii TaxID=118357 RepID=A0A834HAP1_RHOSS|nr:hypothetical protein RHSIM_Rhsim02G0128500 [Rhododendron simsii]